MFPKSRLPLKRRAQVEVTVLDYRYTKKRPAEGVLAPHTTFDNHVPAHIQYLWKKRMRELSERA